MLMLPPSALPTRLRLLVDPPPAFPPARDLTSTRPRSVIGAWLLHRRTPAAELAPDEPANAVSCG